MTKKLLTGDQFVPSGVCPPLPTKTCSLVIQVSTLMCIKPCWFVHPELGKAVVPACPKYLMRRACWFVHPELGKPLSRRARPIQSGCGGSQHRDHRRQPDAGGGQLAPLPAQRPSCCTSLIQMLHPLASASVPAIAACPPPAPPPPIIRNPQGDAKRARPVQARTPPYPHTCVYTRLVPSVRRAPPRPPRSPSRQPRLRPPSPPTAPAPPSHESSQRRRTRPSGDARPRTAGSGPRGGRRGCRAAPGRASCARLARRSTVSYEEPLRVAARWCGGFGPRAGGVWQARRPDHPGRNRNLARQPDPRALPAS